MADIEIAGRPPRPAPSRDDYGQASPGAPRAKATAKAAYHARRVLDGVLALIVLLFLLPLLLIVALLIKLDSRGPVFFRQRRLGKDEQPFTVLKFRTMITDAASDAHIRYIAELAAAEDGGAPGGLKKLTNDSRVTRVGRTLRRLSIDEIPQFLNVLVGQMALVGPRPAIEYELEHYDPKHFERFEVRPGITGLWQVSGRNTLGFKEMLDLDVEYVRHATLLTDVQILVKTPRAAVKNAA